MRLIAVFVGVVMLIAGAVGLFAPVSVSPELRTVDCGTAISPDLSDARDLDDGSAANIPVPGAVIVDTNYTELCRMELADRRILAITVLAAGVFVLAVAAGVAALSRSRQHAD